MNKILNSPKRSQTLTRTKLGAVPYLRPLQPLLPLLFCQFTVLFRGVCLLSSHLKRVKRIYVCISLAFSLLVCTTMADRKPGALAVKLESGLFGGGALVSGSMIGSGVFTSPQFVLAYAGSPGASLLIWPPSGFVAACAKLGY